jgi:hypothetical protein
VHFSEFGHPACVAKNTLNEAVMSNPKNPEELNLPKDPFPSETPSQSKAEPKPIMEEAHEERGDLDTFLPPK